MQHQPAEPGWWLAPKGWWHPPEEAPGVATVHSASNGSATPGLSSATRFRLTASGRSGALCSLHEASFLEDGSLAVGEGCSGARTPSAAPGEIGREDRLETPVSRLLTFAGGALCALALTIGGLPHVFASGGDPSAGRSGGDESATRAIDPPPGRAGVQFFAFEEGCRFFDTRVAGGPIAVSGHRDLSVDDDLIDGQGGQAPCAVPDHAIAVDVSLSTLGNSPTNPGFVRVGAGGEEPRPTVLQFQKNQGISVTTTAPLAEDKTIRVKVFAASTGMTGDLLGYWTHVYSGRVFGNGTTFSGTPGLLAVEKQGTGSYRLTVDRFTFQCWVQVTVVNGEGQFAGLSGFFIDIATFDSAGNAADRIFDFVMTCPD